MDFIFRIIPDWLGMSKEIQDSWGIATLLIMFAAFWVWVFIDKDNPYIDMTLLTLATPGLVVYGIPICISLLLLYLCWPFIFGWNVFGCIWFVMMVFGGIAGLKEQWDNSRKVKDKKENESAIEQEGIEQVIARYRHTMPARPKLVPQMIPKRGIVTSYSSETYHGFIKPSDNTSQVFFEMKPTACIKEGDVVEFTLRQNPYAWAMTVRVIQQ